MVAIGKRKIWGGRNLFYSALNFTLVYRVKTSYFNIGRCLLHEDGVPGVPCPKHSKAYRSGRTPQLLTLHNKPTPYGRGSSGANHMSPPFNSNRNKYSQRTNTGRKYSRWGYYLQTNIRQWIISWISNIHSLPNKIKGRFFWHLPPHEWQKNWSHRNCWHRQTLALSPRRRQNYLDIPWPLHESATLRNNSLQPPWLHISPLSTWRHL